MFRFVVGRTYAFVYRAGSRPGSYRVVTVDRVDGRHVSGADLYASADSNGSRYRQFVLSNVDMSSVVEVATPNEEVFDAAAISSTSIPLPLPLVKQIFEHINPGREGVRTVSVGTSNEVRLVVARRADIPRVNVSVEGDTLSISFLNREGETLDMEFTLAGNHSRLSVGAPITQAVAEELVQRLNDHLLIPVKPATANSDWANFASSQKHGIYSGVS